MGLLVDWQLEECISMGVLIITPYNHRNIQSNSIDVTLSDSFVRYESSSVPVDPYVKESVRHGIKEIKVDEIILNPGEFVLAETIEYIELPGNICCQIEGKSSFARLGLSIHQTGGWVDCGFVGTLTLEMTNVMGRPLILRKGDPIAQLVFFETEHASIPYKDKESAKYVGQTGAQPSMYYKNVRR